MPSVVVEAWTGTVPVAARTLAAEALRAHRLGVIGPQRDGVDIVAHVDHQRGVDGAHRSAADDRDLRHSASLSGFASDGQRRAQSSSAA